ncbi:MAG: VCBS repeat-containing protein [Proteobacteria bacterium]|nr:VCBS repeat-containing protein [Pseudomonadota bacterium]
MVVENDSGSTLTLNLVASGTSLLPPTMAVAFSPSSIYANTGVSTLSFTLTNPNPVPVRPVVLNVNLPSGIQTAANANPISTCGGGSWSGSASQAPANDPQPNFFGQGSAMVPANGSCVISIDVTSSNVPGTYTYTPPPLSMQEVWSASPASATLAVLSSTPVDTTITRSLIQTPTPPVTPGPRVASFVPTLQSPRSFEFADLNGDGYLDIVVTPSFPYSLPKLPIMIWLNRGDGTFYDGTADIIEGTPPITWSSTQTLIGDFNGDGRPDILFINSGAEFAVADGSLESGFNNTLLLSQPNGKYRDATSQIPSNPALYNHMGGLGDANGDGNLDILVNAFQSTLLQSNGVRLYYGDGKGNFTDATDALPPEIRFMPNTQRPGGVRGSATFSYQETGCAALADLDGDGKAEVITGSYSGPDGGPDFTKTIRFHKLGTDGNFVERARVNIPDAIANIDYGYDPPPAEFRGLGCSQILAGDFNGDGRPDLLIQWEGAGKAYIEILRNDGNFHFTDVTIEALGSYSQGYMENNKLAGIPGHYRLLDINGDGALDIVIQTNASTTQGLLQHTAYLNDGSGHFTSWTPQGLNGARTPSEILAVSKCTTCSYMPFVFDTTKSGIASLVLLDYVSMVSSSTPAETTAVYLTTVAPTNLSASATETDCIFAWAETHYSTIFSPPGGQSLTVAPYRYRSYSSTNSYFGVSSADNRLYYFGALSDHNLLSIGPVATWLASTKCR